MKLTKTVIDGLPAPEHGQKLYWDDKQPGFGVRITPTGYKAYVFQRRIHGRNRRIRIAPVGDLTVEQARKQAAKLAGAIADNRDPVAERRRHRLKSVTLRAALADYLAARPLKPTTVADIQRALGGLADWMGRPVTGITREMIGTRHRRLGERSPARANLTMRYLRAVLNYAAAEYVDESGAPLLRENPVSKLSATRSWYRIERRRTVIKPSELAVWMRAVLDLAEVPEREPGTGWGKPLLRHGVHARDYYLLVLLTGLRRNEALGLRWADVDFRERTLTVTDTKNREPHTLPLSDYLYDLLKARQPLAGREYVFSISGVGRLTNLRYAQRRVEIDSGVLFTVHDLRRTFATVAESLDIPAYAVKALLNHKMGHDVTAGYVVITVERLRAPMQRITDYILRLGGLRDSADILELPSAERAPK